MTEKEQLFNWAATGRTYQLRDKFISWGWRWDPVRGAWTIENETADSPCVKWINEPFIHIILDRVLVPRDEIDEIMDKFSEGLS